MTCLGNAAELLKVAASYRLDRHHNGVLAALTGTPATDKAGRDLAPLPGVAGWGGLRLNTN